MGRVLARNATDAARSSRLRCPSSRPAGATGNARTAEGVGLGQNARLARCVEQQFVTVGPFLRLSLGFERMLQPLAGIFDILSRLIDADILPIEQRGADHRGPAAVEIGRAP